MLPALSKKHEGFYIVTGIDFIIINKNGEVINLLNNKHVKPTLLNNGHLKIYINHNQKTVNFLIHRVLAKTFIERPIELINIDFNHLKVIHIDGDKQNISLDNLKWVSNTDYVKFDYDNFISTKHCVVSKNVLNGQIKKFDTVTQCAQYFNISVKRLTCHLKSKYSGRITKNWNVFLLENKTDWPILKSYQIGENKWDTMYGYWYAKTPSIGKTLINKDLEKLCHVLTLNYTEVYSTLNNNKECFINDWNIWYSDLPLKT